MTVQTASLKGLDLLAEIERLKRERNAVILAHYYQKPEIQDLADFVGDSLDLSRKAAATDAEVIAFCGVRFMAETAKILSPEKTVILPDMDAGCSLEDSCPPDQFAAFRAAHPDHIALTYINCSAAVKALSDIIVTSSSAQIILDQIPKDQKIIFGPDRHLGGYLARKLGREMLLWPGICIVHQAFSETELLKLKAEHPDAPVAAHPECPPHIIDHADHVGSTKSILDFALTSPAETILVATEPHIIHQMEKAAPHKTFIGVPGGDGACNCNMCPYMALNTLEKLYVSLRDLQPRIELSPEIMDRARVPLERMLEMAGRTVGQGDVGTPVIDDPAKIDPRSSARRIVKPLERMLRCTILLRGEGFRLEIVCEILGCDRRAGGRCKRCAGARGALSRLGPGSRDARSAGPAARRRAQRCPRRRGNACAQLGREPRGGGASLCAAARGGRRFPAFGPPRPSRNR